VVRFTIPLPEKGGFGQYLSLSPDGRRVAFIISGEGGTRLWVRALDSLQLRLRDWNSIKQGNRARI
jgi:Tol biopolymer transport system component